jgi:hypothetical protein
MHVSTEQSSLLNRRQWLVLSIGAVWTAFWAWLVTALPFGGVFLELGEPLKTIVLMLPPVVIGILFVGRGLVLQNWRQWALLVVMILLQAWVWLSFISDPERLTADDLWGLAAFLSISLAGCGFVIGLLSPPGPWARTRRVLSTPERRQLAVLLCASAWVSLMAISVGSGRNSIPEIVRRSLPVLMFAGVLYWWIGRKASG